MTPSSSSTRSSLCLGLCLGAREVGIAVVSREHLVLSTSARPASTGCNASSRSCTNCSNATAPGGSRWRRPGPSAHAITEQWTTLCNISRPLIATAYTADEIRASHRPTGRQSTRALAELLGTRFPELAPHAPSTRAARRDRGVVPEHAKRHVVSSHERYWSRAFLAVAGALHDLEADLLERLQLQLPLSTP